MIVVVIIIIVMIVVVISINIIVIIIVIIVLKIALSIPDSGSCRHYRWGLHAATKASWWAAPTAQCSAST